MLRFKPIEASRSRQWTATDGATTVATIIITDPQSFPESLQLNSRKRAQSIHAHQNT
jgi:hypothetical protein